MGLKTFDMTPKLIVRSILFAFNPNVANSLGIKSISDEINNFFVNLVKNTVDYRTQNGIERDDFLHQLIDLFKINGEIDYENVADVGEFIVYYRRIENRLA